MAISSCWIHFYIINGSAFWHFPLAAKHAVIHKTLSSVCFVLRSSYTVINSVCDYRAHPWLNFHNAVRTVFRFWRLFAVMGQVFSHHIISSHILHIFQFQLAVENQHVYLSSIGEMTILHKLYVQLLPTTAYGHGNIFVSHWKQTQNGSFCCISWASIIAFAMKQWRHHIFAIRITLPMNGISRYQALYNEITRWRASLWPLDHTGYTGLGIVRSFGKTEYFRNIFDSLMHWPYCVCYCLHAADDCWCFFLRRQCRCLSHTHTHACGHTAVGSKDCREVVHKSNT